MEMVRDQSTRATAGWRGFQYHPTSKQSAKNSVDKLSTKWFYRQVTKCKKKSAKMLHKLHFLYK